MVTVRQLEAKALVETLADKLSEIKAWLRSCMTRWQKIQAKTIGDTQGKVKTKALLQALTYILAYVEAKALVDSVRVGKLGTG